MAWNVDVPTLWQCQKVSNDHSDRFREIPVTINSIIFMGFKWFQETENVMVGVGTRMQGFYC